MNICKILSKHLYRWQQIVKLLPCTSKMTRATKSSLWFSNIFKAYGFWKICFDFIDYAPVWLECLARRMTETSNFFLFSTAFFSKIISWTRAFPAKPHSHDMLNIHMLKLYGKSICKALDLIFQSCIKHGEFRIEWKICEYFIERN